MASVPRPRSGATEKRQTRRGKKREDSVELDDLLRGRRPISRPVSGTETTGDQVDSRPMPVPPTSTWATTRTFPDAQADNAAEQSARNKT
jgi:hypothetical protein